MRKSQFSHEKHHLDCPSARFKPPPSGGQIASPLCRTATIALHILQPWRSYGLSLGQSYGLQHCVSLRMGHQVPLPSAHRRCGPACTGEGATDLRALRDQAPARGGEQGPGAHPRLRPASHGPERHHATDQGTHREEAVRGMTQAEKALLGTPLLGTRLLLCHRWSDDRRDGAGICGASLRARSARQLSHGVITTGL